MQGYVREVPTNTIICREGDPSNELYFVKSGALLVCTLAGREVKVLSRFSAGQYFGELSFFDGFTRSGTVIATEPSVLIQIPRTEILGQLPLWYKSVCQSLTKRIRLLDQVIQDGKIRHATTEDQKALTIEEQRHYLELITHQDD